MGSRVRATRAPAHLRAGPDRYTASAMPTYEYACRSCGHTFEIVQSMSDDTLTTCPKCEGELRKIFAPPAIAFKGSGFYATDHGKKSKPSEGSEKKPDGGDAKDTKETNDTKGVKKDTSTSGTKDGSSSGTSPAPAKKEATPS
jgi:putative FmdB family regulatory protein